MQSARPRSRDGDLRPLLADGRHAHVELRPQDLQAEFEMLVDLGRIGGGGRHDPAVGAEARRRAVVHDEAVLAQHDAVARLADRQRRERVDVHPVEQGADVGPLKLDLAEGRDVDQPDRAAHRPHLASRPSASSPFPLSAGNMRRAATAPVSTKTAPALFRKRVGRREAGRPEIDAAMVAGEGAERHRRPGRAEHGDSGLGDRLAARLRHDGEARDVRQLALVGRHAERRVALEMLDRDEAFLVGQHDVLRSDVVLEIDEGHAFRPLDMPEGGEAARRVRGLAASAARRRGSRRSVAASAPLAPPCARQCDRA